MTDCACCSCVRNGQLRHPTPLKPIYAFTCMYIHSPLYCNRLSHMYIGTRRVARWFIFKPKYQFGHIFEELDGKMLIHLIAIWNSLRTYGIFYGHCIGTLCTYSFGTFYSDFGIMYHEKFGNPYVCSLCMFLSPMLIRMRIHTH
jgi:hypothetical protein